LDGAGLRLSRTFENIMRHYRGDFEVHITVLARDKPSLAPFLQWCRIRECKCVWIVLARGEHVEQPMATWRRQDTNLAQVVEEAQSCAADLNRAAIPVVRVKVEAAPDNDEVPLDDTDAVAHAIGNYFEHHIKLLRDKTAPREALLRACERSGAHLSRNAFREVGAGQEERFVTIRSYGVGWISSERHLRQLLAVLEGLGEQILKHESEYCVYDSNIGLDAGWLDRLM
jgi:hypothetical protein